MNFYKKVLEENIDIWTDNKDCVRIKDNKVVVKLRNPDQTFMKSAIVPTAYYPLNNSINFKVFTHRNTEWIEDKRIEKAFDKTNYKVGRCYNNTTELIENLVKYGIDRNDLKSYVGWLFVSVCDFPVHHCWCVYKNNMVLDISENFYLHLLNLDKIESGNLNKSRENLAEFTHDILNALSHSERCFPIGQVTPGLLYIGSECSGEDGKLIYNKLMKDFPDHDCDRGCDANGYNPTQRIMKEKGYI